MKKRWTGILLTAVMLLSAAGCGSQETEAVKNGSEEAGDVTAGSGSSRLIGRAGTNCPNSP